MVLIISILYNVLCNICEFLHPEPHQPVDQWLWRPLQSEHILSLAIVGAVAYFPASTTYKCPEKEQENNLCEMRCRTIVCILYRGRGDLAITPLADWAVNAVLGSISISILLAKGVTENTLGG